MMVQEEEFEAHLKTITPVQWDMLFRLLPLMESSAPHGTMQVRENTSGGFTSMPYMIGSPIVDQFQHTFYELGLCVIFDWGQWKEGEQLISDKQADFRALDTATLCKLLTAIVRSDRFNEGYLVANMNNGIVQRIIRAIQHNEMTR